MARNLQITTSDDHSIILRHFTQNAKELVIASHGITTEKTEDGIYETFANDYLSPRFDTLLFDFRGHGESTLDSRDVTVCGEVLDLMSVLEWSKKHGYEKIHHLGTSFGASITLLAASAYDLTFLTSVVFWNPVINYWNTFVDAKVEWGKEFFNQKRPEELIQKRQTAIPETDFAFSPIMTQELLLLRPEATKWPREVPLLIIHGDRDTLVPFQDSRSYAQSNKRVAKFIRLREVDHGFDEKLPEAMTLAQGWFRNSGDCS